MNPISPVITIKPKKIEFISQYLCDNEEIIYASKVQFNYPPNRNLPAQIGYAILTYGFVYLFTKEENELILQEQVCIFNCQEIKYIDDKGKETKSAILIKTDSEENLFTIFNGKRMEVFYEYLVYSITIISNGRSSHFVIPKLTPHIPVKSFPIQFRIYKRSLYLIHLDMKSEKIPKSSLEGANYFNRSDIYFRGQLLINSSFHPNNYGNYYGKAIGYEPNILVVVFQNFNDGFSNLFETILNNSIRIVQIKFDEYINSPVINFEKVGKTSIEKFQFVNSSFHIVENFLNGCINYNYDIKNIKINSVEVQKNDLINIFDSFNKLKCFANLASFSLVKTKIEFFKQFPFEVFAQFLQSHPRLESLTLSDIDADGTTLFEKICKSNTNLYELHLNSLIFDDPLNFEDDQNPLNLPHNIVLLDFSKSRFKNLSMTPLLQFLTKDDQNTSNLMVNFEHLEPKENTFVKAFKTVDLKKCQSKIVDFNWSGNHLSPDLFNFLSTQKNLQNLALLDMTVEKQNGFFQALTKFLNGQKLTGIELGCQTFDHQFVNPFLNFLTGYKSLKKFHFHCQQGQNEIAEKIVELMESSENLSEVFIEAKGLSNSVCFKVGSAFVKNKSVVSGAFLTWEIDRKDPKIDQIVTIVNHIRKLKLPTTMEQRTASCISLKKKELAAENNHELGDNNVNDNPVVVEEEEEQQS